MSDNIVDEMYVKVGLDTSDYNGEVEKITENNDKLAEGLEDVEKQFDKTTKATQENAKKVKQSDDSQKGLNTSLNTTVNYLQKIASLGAGFATGMGITKWVAGLQQANDHLRDMAALSDVSPQNFVKAGYMATAMGGNAESMQGFLRNLSYKSADMKVTGNPELLKALNTLGVSPRDANDKVKDPLTLFFELTKAFSDSKAPMAEKAFVMSHFGATDNELKVMMRGYDEVKKNYDSQDEKFIMSNKDFQDARALTKNMGEVSNHFDSLSNLVAKTLTPNLKGFSDIVLAYADRLQQFAKDNPELTEGIIKGGALAATAGTMYGAGKIVSGGYKVLSGKGKGLSTIGGFADVQKVYVVNMDNKGLDPRNSKNSLGGLALLLGSLGVAYASTAPVNYDEYLTDKEKWDAFREKEINPFEKIHGEGALQKARKEYGGHFKEKASSTEEMFKIYRGYMEKWATEKSQALYSTNGKYDPSKMSNSVPILKEEIAETNALTQRSNALLFSMNGFIQSISDAVKNNTKSFSLGGENNAEFRERTNFGQSTPTKPITSQMAKDRMQQTLDYFMERGYTKNQAMGIAANIQAESGFDHQAKGLEKRKDGSTYYSHGIAQWNGDRLKDFKNLFGKDIQESSFKEQLSFILWELENTEKGANKALKGSTSLFESVSAMTKLYERPANADQRTTERYNQARSMMNTYGEMGINPLAMGGMSGAANINNSKTMTEVTIQSVVINTTASSLTGIGQDLADGVKGRMLLGQLSGGMR